MLELKSKMPSDEYLKFTTQGYFTIRRSHRFWAGIFSDQTIEQWLMRQLKSPAGLTRGRGFTESTAAKFVHALPKCVHLCHSLEKFSGTHCESSEQHQDLSLSTQKRDIADLHKFVNWLHSHQIFEYHGENVLVNIATGMIGDPTVNFDEALAVGKQSIAKMIGQNYNDLTLGRNSKVKSLASTNNTIKVHDKEIVINPYILFNRISCVLNTSEDLAFHLTYELCPDPPSLFDNGQMRKSNKSNLRQLLLQDAMITTDETNFPPDSLKTLDGGHFRHSLKWPEKEGLTYDDLCQYYRDHAISSYVSGLKIIFDGYSSSLNTKITEHNRRKKFSTSPNMLVSPELPVTTSQTEFLSNGHNKEQFISLLVAELEKYGIATDKAIGDADTLIVWTGLNAAYQCPNTRVYVIGTDTDLLVLLMGRRELVPCNLYMNFDKTYEMEN